MSGIVLVLVILVIAGLVWYYFATKPPQEVSIQQALSEYDNTVLPENRIHLGIIPDGNRRWRKSHNCDLPEYLNRIKKLALKAMEAGQNKQKYCNLAQIDALSLYVLSKDNLTKRNDDTITMIRECLKKVLSDEDEWIPWDRVRIQFVGELQQLPEDILALCEQISNKGTGDFVITAAIGYDPIIDAKRITSKDTKRPAQRDIDLVIRSGGELRSSGFFPLQTLYSEWIYTNTLFPDLTVDTLNASVNTFLKRKRNFGK